MRRLLIVEILLYLLKKIHELMVLILIRIIIILVKDLIVIILLPFEASLASLLKLEPFLQLLKLPFWGNRLQVWLLTPYSETLCQHTFELMLFFLLLHYFCNISGFHILFLYQGLICRHLSLGRTRANFLGRLFLAETVNKIVESSVVKLFLGQVQQIV